MGCRGEAISHLGEQQKHPVPSKQNFNCTQSNKSNPVVQHTGETVAALGGCKTEKTNGNFGGGEKSTRGSAGTCPRDRGSCYRAGSALLRLRRAQSACRFGEKRSAQGFLRGRHINVHTIPSGEVTTTPVERISDLREAQLNIHTPSSSSAEITHAAKWAMFS